MRRTSPACAEDLRKSSAKMPRLWSRRWPGSELSGETGRLRRSAAQKSGKGAACWTPICYLFPMDFTDDAIVLSARRHGEANAVLSVLTRLHGRHMGLVKGGASRRQRPMLQI